MYFNIKILKVANYIKCNTDVPGDYVEYNNEEKWFMSILFSLPITISFSILLTIRRECRNGRKESDVVRTLYDLLFVAAVTAATHVLLHVEDGQIHAEYLVKFVLIFIPIWWAWVGQTIFVNRFGKDLFHQRIFDPANVFVLIMTSSLSADFDPYYLSF